MRALTMTALLASLLTASAAASAPPKQVFTDVGDVQACSPLPNGEVLLGTSGGLLQVDAAQRRKQLWTRLEGLPGTRVHALLQERDTIWVGTEGGLARLSLASGTVERSFSSMPVRAVARHRGALYLGSWNGGLLKLHGDKLSPIAFAKDARRAAQHITALRITALGSIGGVLYVGTAGAGLWRLAGSKLKRVASFPKTHVWSIESDGAGSLLVGTLSGLWKITRASPGVVAQKISSLDARALHRLADGRVLVGTYGSPLQRLAPASRRLSRAEGFVPKRVSYVNFIGSRHGVTCVGTRDGAWVKGPGRAARAHHLRFAGPPSNDISALAIDGTRLYVGSFDGGLAYLEEGRWHRVAGVDRRIDVLALQSASATAPKTLWVGTPRGLYRLRGGAVKRFTRADGLRHQHVHSLALLRDGSLLVGTARGAAIVRGDGVQAITVKEGLPVASVWAVAEDSDGALWIGTSRGLYQWKRRARRYTRYSVSSGHLKEDWVTALALRGDRLYVGSYNAGVVRLTRGEDGALISVALGGGWVNFFGLQVVGKSLYAASMSGLRRLALPEKAGATFQHLAMSAPGRDVTAVAAAKGGLWIASRRGLVFRPSVR